MTQEDLIDWALQHNCTITKRGRSFVKLKNTTNNNRANAPRARDGFDNLMPMVVCKVCVELEIPIPNYAMDAHRVYLDVQKRFNAESDNANF
jgi:hypothetical protein